MGIEEITERLVVIVGQEKAIEMLCDDKLRRYRAKKNVAALRSAISLLRTHPEAQPNEPLTLEELKQMYCQAVWVKYGDGSHGSWGLVELDRITLPAGAYCIIRKEGFGNGWRVYRRPPKED